MSINISLNYHSITYHSHLIYVNFEKKKKTDYAPDTFFVHCRIISYDDDVI